MYSRIDYLILYLTFELETLLANSYKTDYVINTNLSSFDYSNI